MDLEKIKNIKVIPEPFYVFIIDNSEFLYKNATKITSLKNQELFRFMIDNYYPSVINYDKAIKLLNNTLFRDNIIKNLYKEKIKLIYKNKLQYFYYEGDRFDENIESSVDYLNKLSNTSLDFVKKLLFNELSYNEIPINYDLFDLPMLLVIKCINNLDLSNYDDNKKKILFNSLESYYYNNTEKDKKIIHNYVNILESGKYGFVRVYYNYKKFDLRPNFTNDLVKHNEIKNIYIRYCCIGEGGTQYFYCSNDFKFIYSICRYCDECDIHFKVNHNLIEVKFLDYDVKNYCEKQKLVFNTINNSVTFY